MSLEHWESHRLQVALKDGEIVLSCADHPDRAPKEPRCALAEFIANESALDVLDCTHGEAVVGAVPVEHLVLEGADDDDCNWTWDFRIVAVGEET